MLWYAIRVLISAVLIVAVAEVSRRSTRLGGLLASLPLISYLGMIWLYIETRDKQRISQLSSEVFWLVLPSLVLFASMPWLLKRLAFPTALLLGTGLMVTSYLGMLWLLRWLRPGT